MTHSASPSTGMADAVRVGPGPADPPGLLVRQALLILILVACGGDGARGATPADGRAERPGNARPTEKEIKAYMGLAALAGIMIVGIALAAFIILWGSRLRRQLREPLPESALPDRDFWFLKPPKPTVTRSSLPDAHLPPHEMPPPDAPPET